MWPLVVVLGLLAADARESEYCIVGGGPAGLQLQHHLQSAGVQSVLLERDAGVGAFYGSFPRHDTLISINKKYTGSGDPEFNLRHDWNSLLTSATHANGTEFPFTSYTDEYMPSRQLYRQYLQDFARFYDLEVLLNASVEQVTRLHDGSGLSLSLGTGAAVAEVRCGVVVWAAGLGTARAFANPLFTPYAEVQTDPAWWKNKTAVVVGAGQSAFEVAKAVYGCAPASRSLARTGKRLRPPFVIQAHGAHDAALPLAAQVRVGDTLRGQPPRRQQRGA